MRIRTISGTLLLAVVLDRRHRLHRPLGELSGSLDSWVAYGRKSWSCPGMLVRWP